MISAADAVFARLRLWQDVNHDGISQPDEFVPLTVAGIVSIELDYRPTGRRDGLGNFYRYRGVVLPAVRPDRADLGRVPGHAEQFRSICQAIRFPVASLDLGAWA